MKTGFKTTPLLVTILLLFPSCSLYMKRVIGYHDISKKQFSTRLDTSGLNEPNIVFFDVDSSYLQKLVNSHKSNPLVKYYYQPVQIIYYKDAKPVSFIANCFIRGSLTGLKWAEDKSFASFPPQSYLPEDKIINVNTLLKLDLNRKYTIIFLWSNLATNEAQRAIETVTGNLQRFNVKDYIIYIGNIDEALRKLHK